MGKTVDAITLTDALDEQGKLEKVGGRVRLFELAALVPATANAHVYAEIVQQNAVFRRLIRAGGEIARLGWDRPGDANELLSKAETHLSSVVNATITSQFTNLSDGLHELMAEITEAQENGKPRMGLSSGYPDLDNILSGLHGGQLILIGARPGMGKSALGLNISENVADRGECVGFWSLEMSKIELQLRSVSRAARVDSKKLRQGRMTAEEFERVKRAVPTVQHRTSLKAEDNPSTTLSQLRAQAKRLARTENLKLLVVDYLQLMVSAKNEENRNQEISQISRGLKLLARELNIPVIAMCQLNRNLEGRADKRPMLSDLRESGSLEQDADVVIFLYRDDYYNPEQDAAAQGIAEAIVAKNRMGPQETVKLTYTKQTTSFGTLPRQEN
jgi:replicative DNA helicase